MCWPDTSTRLLAELNAGELDLQVDSATFVDGEPGGHETGDGKRADIVVKNRRTQSTWILDDTIAVDSRLDVLEIARNNKCTKYNTRRRPGCCARRGTA